MASNETVLVENAVSKLHYLHFVNIGISTFLNEHFQLVQFHFKLSSSRNSNFNAILCTIFSLSPNLRFVARSGPPFVVQRVLFGWGPGLQMGDVSERENGVRGREMGDRANTDCICLNNS